MSSLASGSSSMMTQADCGNLFGCLFYSSDGVNFDGVSKRNVRFDLGGIRQFRWRQHAKNIFYQIPRAFMRMGMPMDANMAPMNPPFSFFISGMMAALLCVRTLFRARICLALSLDRSMCAYGFSCKCWGRIKAHAVLFLRVLPFLRSPTIFLPIPSAAPRPKAGNIFVPRTRTTLGPNLARSVPIPLPHWRRRVFLRFMTDCIKNAKFLFLL